MGHEEDWKPWTYGKHWLETMDTKLRDIIQSYYM
jgi:hypothetical protein